MLRSIRSGGYKTELTEEIVKKHLSQIPICTHCVRGKGKDKPQMTRTTPKTNLPGNVIHIDIGKYRNVFFLIAVDEATRYLWAIPIKSKDAPNIKMAVSKIQLELKEFNKTYQIKEIHCDRDLAFSANKEYWIKHGIQSFYSATQQHDSMAERNILTIQGIMRSIESTMKFNLHKRMVPYLIVFAAQCVNIRTNKLLYHTGKSAYQIMTNNKYKLHWNVTKVSFGDILLFKVPYLELQPKHMPRYEWGVVVGRELNSEGSTMVMLVDNYTVVSRKLFDENSEATPEIIKLLSKDEENEPETDNDYDYNETNYLKTDITNNDYIHIPVSEEKEITKKHEKMNKISNYQNKQKSAIQESSPRSNINISNQYNDVPTSNSISTSPENKENSESNNNLQVLPKKR
jgi:hypothetical protein